MMKMLMSLMRMVPRSIARKMDAPMIARDRLVRGKAHPTIRMNLENLLLCACSTCPSFPGIRGEALYCASGISTVSIEELGCNCVTCPLYDRCSSFNVAYFCVHGHCGARDDRPMASRLKDLAGSYLERFISSDERAESEEIIATKDGPAVDVTLHFEQEKDVSTNSNVPILQASLGAGIPHTHVCGGRARCSTCRVLITRGLESCAPRNEKEARLARIKGFSPEIRLACQTTVNADVSLRRLVLDNADIQLAIQEGRTKVGDVGREAEVAIMFCDIRSFTSFSEHSLPYDLIHILNRYFETIGSVIDTHGGYIDKYMGDGIMVIFGLDKSMKDHPTRLAAMAAVKILHSLVEFNRYMKHHFNHEFRIGIGIHTGTVILGSLGFHKKKEYTAIGDAVNTASRIESINKAAGTTVLVCRRSHEIVRDEFAWGRKFSVRVKGKQEPLLVYELAIDDPVLLNRVDR